MADKHVLALYSGPNAVKELQAGDSIDPADAGLTGEFVGTTDTQTLTNKTLTEPKIAVIDDANGVAAVTIVTTASAVNGVTVTPSATGNAVDIAATGTDASIVLNLTSKGGAGVKADGSELITADSVTTLTNKTHELPKMVASSVFDIEGGTLTCGAICDSTGAPVIGTYGSGSATRMIIRSNSAAFTPAVIQIYASSTASSSSFTFRPKGTTGKMNVCRQDLGFTTSQVAKILDQADQLTIDDYATLAVPPGSPAPAAYHPIHGTIGQALAPIDTGDPCDQNILFWVPFRARQNGTTAVSVTGVKVCTGTGHNTVGNIRFGIYTNAGTSTSYPSTLVTGSEVVVPVGNVGDTVLTSPAMTASLTPGSLYWLAYVFDNATSEMLLVNPAQARSCFLGGADVATADIGFWNQTRSEFVTGFLAVYVYAALPANTNSLTAGMDYMISSNRIAGGLAGTPNLHGMIVYGS